MSDDWQHSIKPQIDNSFSTLQSPHPCNFAHRSAHAHISFTKTATAGPTKTRSPNYVGCVGGTRRATHRATMLVRWQVASSGGVQTVSSAHGTCIRCCARCRVALPVCATFHDWRMRQRYTANSCIVWLGFEPANHRCVARGNGVAGYVV